MLLKPRLNIFRKGLGSNLVGKESPEVQHYHLHPDPIPEVAIKKYFSTHPQTHQFR